MSDLRGALEALLANRHLERAGTAQLAPLLLGDLASMVCAAGVGGAGNAQSPPGDPDGLVMFLGSAKGDAGTGSHRQLLIACRG
jgi:hypothetical protein